ncbi:MAG: VOC family protein [Candidatus Kariarchaeaceae archaeon]|jgi:catechol-2,3-dioxygenase
MELDLVTLMTNDLEKMKEFYSGILGFEITDDLGQYVEMKSDSVRFALCHDELLQNEVKHDSYSTNRAGQHVELAFKVDDRRAVDDWSKIFETKDVKIIKPPHMTPWGLYTLLFIDPEGNIHEIFCRDN